MENAILPALRAGFTTVFIPKENEKDLAEIPDNVKKHLKLIAVSHADEVIAKALSVPRRNVTLVSGERSKQKRVRVLGVSVEARRALSRD